MKPIFLRIFALWTAVILLAPVTLAQLEKEFAETVDLSFGGTLTVDTYKGSIHLSSWDRPEVQVYARITPPEGESVDYQQQAVNAARVEVRSNGNQVIIRSNYDDVPSRGGWFNNSRNLPFVHYEIVAPRDLDLKVDDYKSEIEIYEFSGNLSLETYKGKLLGENLSGNVRLETYKGTAEMYGIDGSLDIETYKGEVSLSAVRVSNDSRLDTYKGTIELQVPQGQAFQLVSDTGRRANIHVFGQAIREEDSRYRRPASQATNRGGPQLKVSSHKGDIVVTNRN